MFFVLYNTVLARDERIPYNGQNTVTARRTAKIIERLVTHSGLVWYLHPRIFGTLFFGFIHEYRIRILLGISFFIINRR
jgi:hypothetical protein